MNAQRKKVRIGDLLVENKVISESQLKQALDEQKRNGLRLGQALIDLGFLEEQQLLEFLSQQLQIPLVNIKRYKFKPEVVTRLPENHARRFKALLLEDYGSDYLVGMVDPLDMFGYDELTRILKKPIRQAVVREVDLTQAINQLYRRSEQISSLAEQLGGEASESDFDLSALERTGEADEAPVVRLLQTIFEDAVQNGASDIHIEPEEFGLRIRQRVDGVLQEQVMKERNIASPLVSRLKLICGLNISEKRLPQDGRFNMKVGERVVDVRLSTMPIQHGESVVMRLLTQSGGVQSLEETGMPEAITERVRRLARSPHGMLLVTGPTGSGKTTTLYALLKELNQADKKIITVEDPVEYRVQRINQVQVNPKIGLTFANVLRTALRQDPDIIMVGEMRDGETIEIGLRAAMTGHLVLSTLHTNDAISTINRLMDIGAAGYQIAGSVLGILAQRLVRRVCGECAEDYQPNEHELAWMEAVFDTDEVGSGGYKRGRGCRHCNNTGYRGRIGVYELLEIDSAQADALRRNDSEGFVVAARRAKGFRPLALNALDYARQGLTTLDEVMRVANTLDEYAGSVPMAIPAPEASAEFSTEAAPAAPGLAAEGADVAAAPAVPSSEAPPAPTPAAAPGPKPAGPSAPPVPGPDWTIE